MLKIREDQNNWVFLYPRHQCRGFTDTLGKGKNMKVHYRINKGRDGQPMDYEGARHFHNVAEDQVENLAKKELAVDYQVPESEIEICRVEHV